MQSKQQTSLFLTLVILSATIASAQHIFIDKVPAYKELPSCAEVPLSTIVRDMNRGCGDGGVTTSYSCFCQMSSSKYVNLISSDARSACPTNLAAVSQAVDVFGSYCALGVNPTVATITSSGVSGAPSAGSNGTGFSFLTASPTSNLITSASISTSGGTPYPTALTTSGDGRSSELGRFGRLAGLGGTLAIIAGFSMG